MDSNADPLSQLKDIYLPPDPGLWPPAPGWWLIALAGLLLMLWAYKLVKRFLQRRQPWKEMHRHLRALQLTDDPESQRQSLSRMSELVRQFAILKFGRESVSALSGQAWLGFLDSTTKDRKQFSQGIASALGDQLYKSEIHTDLEALRHFLLKWSRECQSEIKSENRK